MRRTLVTLTAGAAVLAAGLILSAAAQAATVPAVRAVVTVPAPQNSHLLAGYLQQGCQSGAYPVYNQIIGTITVPEADYVNGAPGISADVYNIGDPADGVSAGVAVDNSDGQAFYSPFAQWGTSAEGTAPWPAKPGDKLTVVIQNDGASGWGVIIIDQQSGKNWGEVNPDSMQPCEAGAFEETTYHFLTQTTPVAFDHSIVYWTEPNQTGYGKLLGTPPAGAALLRYNFVNSSNTAVAVPSNPADSNYDFTVTDSSLLTPNWAGYQVTQQASIGGGDPYTGVTATWKVPKITHTDPNSYAFAIYLVGIGNANGNGVMAGIFETMSYGKVSYRAFTQLGADLAYVGNLAVHPGDTITAVITGSDAHGWHAVVDDLTTHHHGGVVSPPETYGQRDVEVAELRLANPIGPGYLPLAATTPVTFDHATLTAGGKTYPFVTAVGPGATVQRLEMLSTSDSTAVQIAATSAPDSGKDGFTVRDGATRPAPPKS